MWQTVGNTFIASKETLLETYLAGSFEIGKKHNGTILILTSPPIRVLNANTDSSSIYDPKGTYE